MPWQEQTPMDLRKQFVEEWLSGRFTMSELCAQYTISRKTGYKWTVRYAAAGDVGLADRSRRPHGHPQTTDPKLVAEVVAARERFPDWSAGKIVQWLARREPHRAWPSRTTAYEILRRAGSVPRRRRVVRAPGRRPSVLQAPCAPNDLWTTDFKGEVLTRDGRYCHPLTIRDAFSRRVLRCDALLAETYADTRRRFERVVARLLPPS